MQSPQQVTSTKKLIDIASAGISTDGIACARVRLMPPELIALPQFLIDHLRTVFGEWTFTSANGKIRNPALRKSRDSVQYFRLTGLPGCF